MEALSYLTTNAVIILIATFNTEINLISVVTVSKMESVIVHQHFNFFDALAPLSSRFKFIN
jgi:hypothetical protein